MSLAFQKLTSQEKVNITWRKELNGYTVVKKKEVKHNVGSDSYSIGKQLKH